MEAIQHHFHKLYQGEQSETFDEVDYLQDVAELRYEILELAKKFDLLTENKTKDKSLLKEEDCFPDGRERIAKNGGFAIGSFDAFTGIPQEIYTPYGAIKIVDNDAYSRVKIKEPKAIKGFFQKRKFAANVEKFQQALEKMLGLVAMQADAEKQDDKFDINKRSKAVSKLPWKAVDLPSEIYHVDEKTAQAYRQDEAIYLRSVFDAVNAGLCLTGHPERIVPGTDNEYSVNGQMRTVSEMAKNNAKGTYITAMNCLRELRNPLNAEKYGLSPVRMTPSQPEHEVAQPETRQVTNADFGREM